MSTVFKKIYPIIKKSLRLFSIQTEAMANPIVTVKEGKLRGAVHKLLDGSDYYSFKGVPYAEPPVGKLRFKAPLPLKPWDGVLDALEHGPVCPQTTPMREIIEGNESCLYLNVYTCSLKSNSKIPVMVYIHGGGFQSGSGNDDIYGPEFLLSQNIILVTINYRLEVLGFLCLDTPEVPGNAGMKDQVMALRWVKTNIAQFGGDPENTTIFGESAGGASVTYHLLSQMSQGLFNRGISQSGVCVEDWAIDVDARARAFRIGKFLGKDTEDTEELLEFLQNVPAKQFIGMNFKVANQDEKHRGLPIRISPVVEKKFNGTEAFITEHPVDILTSGKFNPVPLILGYNTREGLVMVPSELKKADFTNKNPSFLVPNKIAQRVSETKLTEYGERIKTFYCGDRDLTTDDVDIVADLQTDLHFLFGAYRFANIYSIFSMSTYLYRFDLCSELNVFKSMLGLAEYGGACHVDDVLYLFHNGMNRDMYAEKEKLRELVHMMTKIWTDFAKTGDPTPDNSFDVKWTPYTANNKTYLNIDHTLSMGRDAERQRLEFWTKLYNEAGLVCDVKSNL